jgi:hypothetical protein
MSAIETQSDVGILSAVLEGMSGEPHDRRRVIDAQLVAFASKPHFPGRLRRLQCVHRPAHKQLLRHTPVRPPRPVPAASVGNLLRDFPKYCPGKRIFRPMLEIHAGHAVAGR